MARDGRVRRRQQAAAGAALEGATVELRGAFRPFDPAVQGGDVVRRHPPAPAALPVDVRSERQLRGGALTAVADFQSGGLVPARSAPAGPPVRDGVDVEVVQQAVAGRIGAEVRQRDGVVVGLVAVVPRRLQLGGCTAGPLLGHLQIHMLAVEAPGTLADPRAQRRVGDAEVGRHAGRQRAGVGTEEHAAEAVFAACDVKPNAPAIVGIARRVADGAAERGVGGAGDVRRVLANPHRRHVFVVDERAGLLAAAVH